MRIHRHVYRTISMTVPCLLAVALARGGVVQTDDGNVLEGTLNLADGQVLLQPRTGQVIRIDAADVLTMTFGPEDVGRPSIGDLPPGWIASDIGAVGLVGSSGFARGAFMVAGSGAGLDGKADAFHFLHQLRTGDFDLIARLARMQNTDVRADTGLMIREEAQPGSRYIALLVRPNNTIRLQTRQSAAAAPEDEGATRIELPLWLKLSRRGDQFTGYWSADGAQWNAVEDRKLMLGPHVLAGVAVSSHDNGLLNTSRYEQLTLTGDEPEPSQAEGERTAITGGIVLRDGTTFTGTIRAIDGGQVRLTRLAPSAQQDLRIPLDQVGRLVYRPVTAAQLDGIVPGATGVLLTAGDFFEGEIRDITAGRVTVDSVILGIRTFDLSRDVAVLATGDVRIPQGAVVARARDGSVLIGQSLRIQPDQIVIDHPAVGRVALGKSQLQSVSALGGRFTRLERLRPIDVQPGPIPQRSAPLTRADSEQVLVLAGGASATWTLDGQYKALLLTVRVDPAAIPITGARLTILADNEELLTTAPLTSIDPAQSIALPLNRVRTLTLRSSAAGAAPAPALHLTAPILIHPR